MSAPSAMAYANSAVVAFRAVGDPLYDIAPGDADALRHAGRQCALLAAKLRLVEHFDHEWYRMERMEASR